MTEDELFHKDVLVKAQEIKAYRRSENVRMFAEKLITKEIHEEITAKSRAEFSEIWATYGNEMIDALGDESLYCKKNFMVRMKDLSLKLCAADDSSTFARFSDYCLSSDRLDSLIEVIGSDAISVAGGGGGMGWRKRLAYKLLGVLR